MLNAAQTAEKWARKSGQATQDFQNGVDAVTESPMERAASQGELAKANYMAAIDSGKWAANLRKVSLAAWKTVTKQVGGARYASGVSAAKAKYQERMTAVLSHIEQGVQSLPPRGNFDANIQRMVQFARHMKEFNPA